jgi:hypothetical protein
MERKEKPEESSKLLPTFQRNLFPQQGGSSKFFVTLVTMIAFISLIHSIRNYK